MDKKMKKISFHIEKLLEKRQTNPLIIKKRMSVQKERKKMYA